MAPTTPSAKKDLVHRPQSSSSKKIKPYQPPSRRQSKGADTSTPLLTQALASEVLKLNSTSEPSGENQAKPTAETQSEDVEMITDSNPTNQTDSHPVTQSSTTSKTLPSSNPSKGKKTDNSESSSGDDSSSDASGSSEDEDDENEEDNANLQPINVEPGTMDGSDDVEIIGGHIMTEIANVATRMPFPAPGTLTLFTVNPLFNAARFEFASTSDLPYELQLYWQLYYPDHVQIQDVDLWAMVTVLSDKSKSNLLELIKKTLAHCINHIELVVGPGGSRFFIIRFKGLKAKDGLRKDNRHDRGVFVSFSSSSTPVTLLIFELDSITSLTPTMSSLLVTMHGLPFPLNHRVIGTTIYGAIKAYPNDQLQLEGIRELNKKPTIAHGGGRVFEVLFKREATTEWFNLCSRSSDYLGIIGWDSKGKETPRTYNLDVRFLPTCSHCGTSSYDGSHRMACPFIKIRNAITKAFGHSTSQSKDQSNENREGNASVPSSSSLPQPPKKIGNFTVRK